MVEKGFAGDGLLEVRPGWKVLEYAQEGGWFASQRCDEKRLRNVRILGHQIPTRESKSNRCLFLLESVKTLNDPSFLKVSDMPN